MLMGLTLTCHITSKNSHSTSRRQS